MLTQKQKNAIENVLILAQYARDSSIATEEDEKIIEKSIKTVEELVGIRKPKADQNKEITEALKKEINSRLNP
jgi:hypothetical protein